MSTKWMLTRFTGYSQAWETGGLYDDLRLNDGETVYRARQLHAALYGRFDGICEVGVVCKYQAEVDESELAGERLSDDHVVNHGERERTHAAAKRIWKSRIIDRADGG